MNFLGSRKFKAVSMISNAVAAGMCLSIIMWAIVLDDGFFWIGAIGLAVNILFVVFDLHTLNLAPWNTVK